MSGVRSYLARNFTVEREIECRLDEPIVDGDRAAVQWWASWVEAGETRNTRWRDGAEIKPPGSGR